MRRQGFSGSQLYPGRYRIETQTLAGPLRIRSDVKIQYITVPEVAPSLSALTLSSTKTTEGSNGQGAYRHHGVLRPHVLAVPSGRSGGRGQARRDDQT